MSIHPGPFHPLNAEDIAAMCEGKGAFASAKQAHRVAKRRKVVSEVYRCPACNFWHLGAPSSRHPLSGKRSRQINSREGRK